MHCRVCDKEKCRNMKIHCQETWHYNCLSVNCTTYCTILRHKVDDLGFRLYEKCMFFRPNTHKGYKNRYDIFDHGHKKLLLCIFSKTYKLWCIEGLVKISYFETSWQLAPQNCKQYWPRRQATVGKADWGFNGVLSRGDF